MSSIDDEIKEEIAKNKILIYGKGTKLPHNAGSLQKQSNFLINMGIRLK